MQVIVTFICYFTQIVPYLKQKAVANCMWMLVVKIKGIERIY